MPRKLSVLYTVVLEEYKKKYENNAQYNKKCGRLLKVKTGLCGTIYGNDNLSIGEQNLLFFNLRRNAPKGKDMAGFWWNPYTLTGYNARVNFINKRIKALQDDNR